MTQKKRKAGTLTRNLMALALIPLFIFGLFVLFFTSRIIYTSLTSEVSNGLEMLARSSYQLFGYLCPGSYGEADGELTKGGQPLAKRTSVVDNIKNISGVDATLFLHDIRYLTTIRNPDGTRAVGTPAAADVAESVLVHGQEYFSDHVLVNDVSYFGFYMPLRSTMGDIVGMLFIGRPSASVMEEIFRNIFLVCAAEACIMAAAVAAVLLYSKKIIYSLEKTEKFLGEVAKGDLTAEPDPKILERQDEIGEMGRFAVVLRDSISGMVGRDPLTGLYNRRCCDVVLQSLAEDCRRKGTSFTVAMGDIDFFKRVNDTYGHQAGDEILRKIAGDIAVRMEHLGFVFRWGGEEFLLVYENMERAVAMAHLEQLRCDLSAGSTVWDGQRIHVTMTFGVANYAEEQDIQRLIQIADGNLYLGKSEGRDRVVCTTPLPTVGA